MNEFNYSSVFAPYMNSFIDMKQTLGYDALRTKWILLEFDNFFIREGETEPHIKREHIERWRASRINDCSRTIYSKYSVWSQFCRHLCHLGIECYIPKLPKMPDSGFTPCIFTHQQVSEIFKACDSLRLHDRHMKTIIFVMPALLRLLYSAGVRISEALSIRNADVNFAQKVIVIRKTKNGEQRLVPLSDTMLSVLEEYVRQRNKMPVKGIGNPDSFLFVSLTGRACVAGTVYNRFRKILDMCAIPYKGNHHGPRVHDLRHTCAVHSLVKMNRNGMDIYCSLPLLSTFMGHKSTGATEQYVRLTAEMYPDLLCQQQKLCSYVFPKPCKSEEYGND